MQEWWKMATRKSKANVTRSNLVTPIPEFKVILIPSEAPHAKDMHLTAIREAILIAKRVRMRQEANRSDDTEE